MGQEITGTFDKATADQLLNKFFSESRIRNNLALAVPKPNLPFNCYLNNHLPIQRRLRIIIMSLNSAKACSTFSTFQCISTSLLKTSKGILWILFQLLFYCSFSAGLVFKMAREVPIHEKGSSYLVSNYRLISLLSIFNKWIEKLMNNRIISHLEKFSILHNNQFGFRSKHSTTHALLLWTDKVQRSIIRCHSQSSCSIFLNLCKALDTVDHKILSANLEYYGITRCCEWLVCISFS